MIEGLEDKTVSAPRDHPFTMQSVGGQMLAVFTEASSGKFSVPSWKFHVCCIVMLEESVMHFVQLALSVSSFSVACHHHRCVCKYSFPSV